MSSKKKTPESVKNLLEIKQEVLEKIVLDIHEMYKKGRFRMVIVSSGIFTTSIEEDENILMQKYNLSKRKVWGIISAVVGCIFVILRNDIESISERLAKKDLENFEKKVSIISRILEKDPTIKNSFYIYSLSKIPFFSSIDWEAEIKVFHSPHEFLVKPPALPVGRMRIEMMDPSESPPKPCTVEFEIIPKDVENMISYLQDLYKALQNLEAVKIVPKGNS